MEGAQVEGQLAINLSSFSPPSTPDSEPEPEPLEAVDPPFQQALLVVYSLTALLSITGNIIVILVLSLGRRSSGELRLFLINLAVSDVTMAVFSIPFTYTIFLWRRWVFVSWFCPIVMAMQHVSVVVSVYTLAVIGVDRYNAIMHPLERRVTKFRCRLVISGIWGVALLVSSAQLVVSRAEPFLHHGQQYLQCDEHWSDDGAARLYTIFIFVVTFALPLASLSATYCTLAFRMSRHSIPGQADRERDLLHRRANRKLIKMLVTIVILFALCWLPLQIFFFCWFFIPGFGRSSFYQTHFGRHVFALSYLACHWLANANSFVNPLVYCFMSENFKADLRDLLRDVLRLRRASGGGAGAGSSVVGAAGAGTGTGTGVAVGAAGPGRLERGAPSLRRSPSSSIRSLRILDRADQLTDSRSRLWVPRGPQGDEALEVVTDCNGSQRKRQTTSTFV